MLEAGILPARPFIVALSSSVHGLRLINTPIISTPNAVLIARGSIKARPSRRRPSDTGQRNSYVSLSSNRRYLPAGMNRSPD
jgi:hypothetical protein